MSEIVAGISLPPNTVIGYRDNGRPIYNIAGGSEAFGEPLDDGSGTGYSGGTEQGGGHPAWQEVLSVVPQDLHEKITPYLEKWDKGVENRLQKVHSDYEPWKPLVSSGIDPEMAQYGINLMNAIEANPRAVYDQLQKHFGFGAEEKVAEQGHGEPQNQVDPFTEQLNPLKTQLDMVTKLMIAEKEAQQAAAEDRALEDSLADARKRLGDYDEDFVLAKMRAGLPLDKAVQSYQQWEQSKIGRYIPKPLIMGGGSSGVPGQQVDVTKLSNKDTNDLVVQYLEAAKHQSQ